MPIISQDIVNDYLHDYRSGKIPKGYTIGDDRADDYFRFKRATLTCVLGMPNCGKTYWCMWYFLALSSRHNLKWAVWSDENSAGQLTRDLIQMYSGKKYMDLTQEEIRKFSFKINHWFTFIDNNQRYKVGDLLKEFEQIECDGCFIDPYSGLDRKLTYDDTYQSMTDIKYWIKQHKKSVYIALHTATEAGRRGALITEGEDKGCMRAPSAADAEFGMLFNNRTDDFIVIHRYTNNEHKRFTTQVHVRKIKDVDTGGSQTNMDTPVKFDYNSGLGFKLDYYDAIQRAEIVSQTTLQVPNYPPPVNFYEVARKENEFDKYAEFDEQQDESLPF